MDAVNPLVAEAMERHEAGELETAIGLYSEAIEADAADALAWTARGVAHFDRGQWQACVDDCSQALELVPGDVFALINRGLAREEQEDLAGAIADFDLALADDPDPEAYFYRGRARLAAGLREEGIEDLEACLLIDPEHVKARFSLEAEHRR